MAIINSDENIDIKFSSGKRWIYLISTNGNLKIEYLESEKRYVITRTDGKPSLGVTDDVGAEFYGNMKAPENLNEVVEHEVNVLAGMQIHPEVSRFTEFDWAFNEDKTAIIVTPVFLDKSTSIVVNFPYPFNSEVEVSVGSRKFVRNGDVLEGNKKLGLKK